MALIPRTKSEVLRPLLPAILWVAGMTALLVLVPGTIDGIRATWDAICAMVWSLLP